MYHKKLNINGTDYPIAVNIAGAGAPTASTAAEVGMFYMDTDTGDVYKCTAASGSTYAWVAFFDLAQTTGDRDDVAMSQKVTTYEIENTFFQMAKKSVNLFNCDSDLNLIGYYFGASGSLNAHAEYSVSHPIKVKGGNTYKFLYDAAMLGGNTRVFVYDVFDGSVTPMLGGLDGDYLTYTPAEDCYIKVNLGGLDVNSFMVCKADEYPAEYVPFTIVLDDAVEISERQKEAILNGASKPSNPLIGKKLSVNGDSICYGAGYTGGYAKIIGERNDMTVQNIGVGGGTIAINGSRHCISRTIENMDANADFAIVEGGVNDASLSAPLGGLSDGFAATLDDTTFYGAFESMLKKLLIRFAGKKVGYIAVHQMTAKYRVSDDPETSYYWAAKKCCEKWGVPFLDLNTSVPPFGVFKWRSGTDEGLVALTDAYTKDGDGWHPNEEGYKKYYVPKIEAWLKTL